VERGLAIIFAEVEYIGFKTVSRGGDGKEKSLGGLTDTAPLKTEGKKLRLSLLATCQTKINVHSTAKPRGKSRNSTKLFSRRDGEKVILKRKGRYHLKGRRRGFTERFSFCRNREYPLTGSIKSGRKFAWDSIEKVRKGKVSLGKILDHEAKEGVPAQRRANPCRKMGAW